MRRGINSHIDLTSCVYAGSYLGYCWKQDMPACTSKSVHQHLSTPPPSPPFTPDLGRFLLSGGEAPPPLLRPKLLIVRSLYLLASLLRLLFSLYLTGWKQSKDLAGFGISAHVKGPPPPQRRFAPPSAVSSVSSVGALAWSSCAGSS